MGVTGGEARTRRDGRPLGGATMTRRTVPFRRALAALGAPAVPLGATASAQEPNVTLDQNIAIIDPTAHWLSDLTSNHFVPLARYDSAPAEVPPAVAESWPVSVDGLTSNQFVPLVRYDFASAEVTPAGAESWTVSEDGLTYTFTIRDGWTWSDGTPVTAPDYEYAFQRIADPATAAPMAYRIYVIEN